MYKELVEMRVRIFSENVTLSVFLLSGQAPRTAPAAGRPRPVSTPSNPFLLNAKSPQHEVLWAFWKLWAKLFLLRLDGLARGLVLDFGFVLFLVALGGGVGVFRGAYGRVSHDEEEQLVKE